MIFGNNWSRLTHFSYSTIAKFKEYSTKLLAKIIQEDQDTLIEQSLTISCDCSIKVFWSSCMFYVLVSGYSYRRLSIRLIPSSCVLHACNGAWNSASHKSLLLYWAATAKSILAVQPSSTSCEFRINLPARTIFTRTYRETSVMFRT